MIEVERIESAIQPRRQYYLTVDGKPLDVGETGITAIGYLTDGSPAKTPYPVYKVIIYKSPLSHKLMDYPIHDISQAINTIEYRISSPMPFNPEIEYDVVVHRLESGGFEISLNYFYRYHEWKFLWSTNEFQRELQQVIDNSPEIKWEASQETAFFDNEFSIIFKVKNPENTVKTEAATCLEVVKELHRATESSLKSKLRRESVMMHFDFPEEVRVPCEQYLLYFAQFLRDLGVQADTALTHEAGQVLFTVTPADKEQALDKIRAALNAYLHLPSNPISDAVNESIAVQRLESNILRLRSDLKLAAAELQAKNTTIEAQQLIIEVQKGLLSGEVIVNSMKDVTPKPKDKDKEELLGGTVSIIPLKGKGLEINLPELFRRLKRLFKEE